VTASMTAATMAAFRKVFIVKNPCWPDFPWNVSLRACSTPASLTAVEPLSGSEIKPCALQTTSASRSSLAT
jgi:hypothetical protein